jgi:hypothetical protein
MGKLNRLTKWPWIVPGTLVGYAVVYDFQTAVWSPPFIVVIPAFFIIGGLFGVTIWGIAQSVGWCVRLFKGTAAPQDQSPEPN